MTIPGNGCLACLTPLKECEKCREMFCTECDLLKHLHLAD